MRTTQMPRMKPQSHKNELQPKNRLEMASRKTTGGVGLGGEGVRWGRGS